MKNALLRYVSVYFDITRCHEILKAMEACREAAKAAVRAATSAATSWDSSRVVTVGVGVMAKTLSNLLVNNHKVSDKRLKDLPLHQALLLCTVVLCSRAGQNANTDGELLSSYVRLYI